VVAGSIKVWVCPKIEMFSAELRQFGNCIGFHWTICCRMVHSNLNSVREAAILVEPSEFAAYR
jgi:hypothetical protein